MASSRIAFVVIGAGCIAAAGAGSYFATRQTQTNGTATASALAERALVAERAPAAASPAATPDASAAAKLDRPSSPTASSATAATNAPAAAQDNPSVSRQTPSRPGEAATRTTRPAPTGRNIARSQPALRAGADEHQAPSAGSQTVAPSAPTTETAQMPEAPPVAARIDGRASTPEPAEPRFEELVVSADSVVGLQMAKSVDSDRAKVEDRVEARVMRDVRVAGQVAIPAGTQALGSVMLVERGGKFRERARLGIRFHTLVMPDGTRLPVTTETIFRYGEAPGNGSAAKVGGGAVAGAILGAIIGGARGAAIGATAGAGAGTAVVMSGERDAAAFLAGTEMTARVLSPVSVTIEK